MIAVPQRRSLAAPLACLLAVLGGALAGKSPELAAGVLAAGVVLAMISRAPAAAAAILIFLTSVVPYGIQNQFGIGGGTDSPGLLLSDVLLLSAIAWALLTLAETRLTKREFRFAGAILVFLAVAVIQFMHGVRAGHELSTAGQELRVLLGFGTFLVVLPLLKNERTRRQFLGGLLVIGFLLGVWGMLQWFGHVSFGAAGDVGVRSGVRLTSDGSGQLQGGEYGYPVVIALCFAALTSGRVRSRALHMSLVVTLALNVASCLFTFERTFWIDALVGIGFVLLRAPARQRFKIALGAPFVLVLAVGALSALAPGEFSTAGQRLLSLGQYSSDDSVRYRVVESGYVLDRVRAHPITGSGLAGTIFWGQPWAQVPDKSYTFSHDGYLWLAWKIGLPAALLLVLLIVWAIMQRGPPEPQPLDAALRRGAQGALAGLLVATASFPSFSALSITCVMGMLLAMAVTSTRRAPVLARARGRDGGFVPPVPPEPSMDSGPPQPSVRRAPASAAAGATLVATRPVGVLDEAGVPYASEDEAPHSGGWVTIGRGDPGSSVHMFLGRTRLEGAWTIGSVPIFGRIAPHAIVAAYAASLPGEWHPETAIRDASGADRTFAWRSNEGGTLLPFDPDELIRNLRSERYRELTGGRRRIKLLRSTYYLVRPLMPRRLQIAVRRAYAPVQARSEFPRWPFEPALHQLTALVLRAVADAAREPLPCIAAWPAGRRWALVLTHDVETAKGRDAIERVRAVEAAAGLRSSWNLVPERYLVDDALVAHLDAVGCEVGVHGLRHDGRDLESLHTLERRLPEMRRWAERWGAVGFRSPSTQRVWEWMPELGFDYDTSYPDSDPYEPMAGGCCSWLPFFNQDLVELPVTLPQDHTVFVILRRDETLWREKAELLREHGGMALIIVHPDYMLDDERLGAYERFLDSYRADAGVWHALPREVADWWRRRAATSLRRVDGGWEAVGPAAREAVVEFVEPSYAVAGARRA